MCISNDTATSDKFNDWDSIDWNEVKQFVRGMQIKIAEAAKEKNWRRVKRLQFKLVNSFRAKLLAVESVCDNKGGKTAGVDGEIWNTGKKKLEKAKALTSFGYQPKPLRRVMIPKSNGKERPLGIPTMKDRAMQCLHKLALEPVAEVTADKDSYGFRPKRSCTDAIERCYQMFYQKRSAKWILEGDIKSCFDNISHGWLLANIPMDKTLLEKWLKAGFVFDGALFPTEEGTPQGGVISPTLANMVLDGLEDLLGERFGKNQDSKDRINKVRLVRYADDFIISGTSRELLENEVKPVVEEFLKERGLELSSEKTKISHIDAGFDFLGFNVRRYKNKLLTKPAKKSVVRFLREVKALLNANKTAKQSTLIILLNLKLVGWCNYYSSGVSKQTFSYVDHRIWEMLWRWACRRHLNKGKVWIKNKYFTKYKDRDWRFADVQENQMLKLASQVPIIRHIKIQREAEVFNPLWDKYFELR